MSRTQQILIVACLVALSTGCRNRCNNTCGNWLTCSPTVAPPPTYGINIPSVARNQAPYYTPGAAPTYNVNPNGQAPTPANQSGASGWRQPTTSARSGSNTNNPNGDSVLTTPTTFVETSPNRPNTGGQLNSVLANGNGNPVIRTASAAPLPGTGVSTTNSANYNSTRGDERLDASRLPVTDASQVRAPSRNYPTGGVANTPFAGSYSAPIGVQQTYAGQAGFYRQSVPGYTGAAVLMPGQIQSQPVVYSGQPVLMTPNGYPGTFQQGFPNSSQPTVLAQSTATTNGQSNARLGWQSRELSSDRTGRF